jgi:hypothetical protein
MSGPGGQGRGEMAPGVTIAGEQLPTKQTSWGRAWVVKTQGLSKKSRLGLGVGGLPGGVRRRCFPRKLPSLVASPLG